VALADRKSLGAAFKFHVLMSRVPQVRRNAFLGSSKPNNAVVDIKLAHEVEQKHTRNEHLK
jgi:hypothetical protein